MKWVATEKRGNTSAASRQSVVHEIHGVNSKALRNQGYTGKKAGTSALEPHTLSPEALGRHPVVRLGRVRQPDFSPGALGHRAFKWFHMHSWPERAARPISKRTSSDSWFPCHRMPRTLQPRVPDGTRAARLSLAMRAASGYFHEAVCSLTTETSLPLPCPAQARPPVPEAGSG